jgi:hypothetical protein
LAIASAHSGSTSSDRDADLMLSQRQSGLYAPRGNPFAARSQRGLDGRTPAAPAPGMARPVRAKPTVALCSARQP